MPTIVQTETCRKRVSVMSGWIHPQNGYEVYNGKRGYTNAPTMSQSSAFNGILPRCLA